MSRYIFNYCPHCGNKLPKSPDFKPNFCCYCGYKLGGKPKNNSHSRKQCTVCYEYINHKYARIIRCSFCGSSYHSNCVSSWLLKYNACPMCQNVFLFPNRNSIELKH